MGRDPFLLLDAPLLGTAQIHLFEPLERTVREDFEKGDGNELKGHPAKMQAVHSSSALSVNIFQYWLKNKQVSVIAAACSCNSSMYSASIVLALV